MLSKVCEEVVNALSQKESLSIQELEKILGIGQEVIRMALFELLEKGRLEIIDLAHPCIIMTPSLVFPPCAVAQIAIEYSLGLLVKLKPSAS